MVDDDVNVAWLCTLAHCQRADDALRSRWLPRAEVHDALSEVSVQVDPKLARPLTQSPELVVQVVESH